MKKRISLTNWAACGGMAAILVATLALLFYMYVWGWTDTTLGSIAIPLLAIFAVWTLVEIIVDIMRSVRIDGKEVSLGGKKRFKLEDFKEVVPVLGGDEMPESKTYRNPELQFRMTDGKKISINLSRITDKKLELIRTTLEELAAPLRQKKTTLIHW